MSKRNRKASKSDSSSAELGAKSSLRLIRETFKKDQSKYKDFLRICKQFRTRSIDKATLVSLVKSLFRAHPQLLLGFNEYLPEDHKIVDTESEVVKLSSSCGKGPSDQPAGQEVVADRISEEQRARNFVEKVSRFCQEEHVEHVSTEFFQILDLYKKTLISIEEVTRRISSLFVGHEDWVEEFAFFLPPCNECGFSPACKLQEIIVQPNSRLGPA